MMNNVLIKKLTTAVVLASSLSLSGVALADDNSEGHDKKRGCHKAMMKPQDKLRKVLRKLDLSDEQREQVKAIKAAKKDKSQAVKAKMKQYHEEMRTLIESDNYSEDAVLNLRAQYQTTFDEKAVLFASSMNEINALLTDEQLAKKEKIIAKMKEKRERKMEKCQKGE